RARLSFPTLRSSDLTWGGVALTEVVAEARVKPAATHVLVHAEHGYTTNLSLEDFLRADNMLADTRNGELITPEHGWPLRLLVPHLYFWKSAKWSAGSSSLTTTAPDSGKATAITITVIRGRRSATASRHLSALGRVLPPGWRA